MNIILKPFAWLLLLFYNVVDNYGVALLLFALLVKIILFPLSLKGKKSMIQMNMLSGKMQKLQKMYGQDKERYNLEIQKLYEKEKVNPMGGCLWSMIPLFILIPLYSIIRQPLQYMMGLSAEQISAVAEAVNWAQVSIDMGWVKNVTDVAANTYSASGGGHNELFLASLINESNLAAVQAAVGDARVMAMNFNFLGMDLSQIPTWKFWSNGFDWTTIGLFVLVLISAGTGLLFSRIMQKTNNINNQTQNAQAAQTNKMMMWMSPIMSLWIGFMMPGLLCIYWIANNLLSMVQELICGKILKKDYEEAARQRKENELREKEEEKQRKREAAERRAREQEEAKKHKKSAPKKTASQQDRAVAEVSRVGLRTYARGRAYDPDRFGGVTPYHDPAAPVDEAAIEAALASRGEDLSESGEQIPPPEEAAQVREKENETEQE